MSWLVYYKVVCRQLLTGEIGNLGAYADPLACHIACDFLKEVMRFAYRSSKLLWSRLSFGVLKNRCIDCTFAVSSDEVELRQEIVNFFRHNPSVRWCYADQEKIILRSACFDRKDYETTWTLGEGLKVHKK